MKSYKQLCAESKSRIRQITARELHSREESLLIDIREPDEVASGILPGALCIPRGRLEKLIEGLGLQPGTAICLYCHSGGRSALATEALQSIGYTNIHSLAGGIMAWQAEGFSIVQVASSDAVVVNNEGESAWQSVDHSDWASIRADYPISTARSSCSDGVDRALVYLDHAATTHPPATALRAYARFLGLEYANVHRGTHRLARAATERFDAAYGTCARFIGAELDQGCVVFTANTTHACDMVAHVMAELPGKVLVTDLEHHSNDLPHRCRNEVVRVGLTSDLRIDMDELERTLQNEQIKLVAVCGAANITGWMPPIHEIARLAHQHGALICVDAAQLMAHAPVDVRPFGHPEHIDFLTAAGHKMYAPFGVGFLYGPRAILDAAPPYLPGGGTASAVSTDEVEYMSSPDRHQGGTPNIAGVVGMAHVLEFLLAVGMDRIREHELKLLRRAWDGIKAIDGITIYGPDVLEERVGIIPFNVKGVSDLMVAAVLGEEAGIAVRNGRFCAHIHADQMLAEQSGHTVEVGVPSGAVRASFGIYNTESEVDRLVDAVRMVAQRKWVGSYTVKGGGIEAASAGRCADAWMETTEDSSESSDASGDQSSSSTNTFVNSTPE
jgi:selenocysteine lyase/cysteine desulfurase/rhodanese-related sulfurtransferase